MSSQTGILAALGFAKSIELSILLQEIASTDHSGTKLKLPDAISMVSVGIIGGATSVSKVSSFWNDKLLAEVAGLDQIPHDSNIGRAFKRQSNQTIADIEALPQRLEEKIKDNYVNPTTIRKNATTEELIDFDGTPHESYGKQEGSVKGLNHKKKGGYCYQSLLAIDPITKAVKLGWLQSGNTHCANGIVEFSKQLHSLSPNKKKFYRLDSGFFGDNALTEFESQGNGYLVKAKLTSGIKGNFDHINWTPVAGKPGCEGWEEARFSHACTGWKKEREFVAVRKKTGEGKDGSPLFSEHTIDQFIYFCYINTRKMTPWATHKFYGKRASCENVIEELKNQTSLGKIKSNDFRATTLYFHCAILAYNLMRWMAACTGKKQLIKWEISNLRCFLIRIAGRLVRSARRIKIKINGNHFYQEEIKAWMRFCAVF